MMTTMVKKSCVPVEGGIFCRDKNKIALGGFDDDRRAILYIVEKALGFVTRVRNMRFLHLITVISTNHISTRVLLIYTKTRAVQTGHTDWARTDPLSADVDILSTHPKI